MPIILRSRNRTSGNTVNYTLNFPPMPARKLNAKFHLIFHTTTVLLELQVKGLNVEFYSDTGRSDDWQTMALVSGSYCESMSVQFDRPANSQLEIRLIDPATNALVADQGEHTILVEFDDEKSSNLSK
jgi:hypothetical protein